ncbi:MAG: DNA starvation/stationary phase protection protein Dps [Nibricoccus sp.]
MKTTLWNSSNDQPKATRTAMIALLNQQLADALDLGLQSKQAHWNVKGPSFIALHELFDEVAEKITGFVDEVAERIVALGGIAEGTVQTITENTRLTAYPLTILSGNEHVQALAAALAHYAESTRAAIETATKAGDAGTADLFTGISRDVDDLLWKVEAHAAAKS